MSSVVIQGDTSGAVTLSAPAVAGTVTVTLPSSSGTMLTTASTTGISGSAISSGTVAEAYGGTGTNTGYYGFKNRIINGGMVIDQRNAGAAVTGTTSVVYNVDRYASLVITDGVMTFQQVSDAPTGFKYSLKATTTTADSSLSATQRAILLQRIEGYNVSDFALGSASAVQFTLSFWVKSTLTGTFGGSFQNNGSDRAYPFTYTISSASTWEQKTITITGDTTGTWNTTTGTGLQIVWGLGVGSTNSATAGSWQAGDYNSATGATSVIGTLNATWQVTGVQLEKGSTATSFDYRPYGTELALCQRYFEKSVSQGTSITTASQSASFPIYSTTVANTVTYAMVRFAVTKRTSPTVSTYPYGTPTNLGRFSNDTGTDFGANSAYVSQAYDSFFNIANSSGGTLTTGGQLLLLGNWYATAEL